MARPISTGVASERPTLPSAASTAAASRARCGASRARMRRIVAASKLFLRFFMPVPPPLP